MQRAQRGFGLGLGGSLFDTVIVPLVIFCILGVVAWSSYDTYRTTTRVKAGLALAAEAQAAIDKAFAAKGPADFSAAGRTGEHVQSIAVARSGVITVRYTADVAGAGENTLQIVPVANGKALDLSDPASAGRKYTWQCGGKAGATTLPEKYRPDCR